jgi:hypothetical protein
MEKLEELSKESGKLPKGLCGIAGEYLVAGELSRRGYMASITLRNNDSIDIHASKIDESTTLAIQVKTKQFAGRAWPLSKKAELLNKPNMFYIFVSLKGLFDRPDYFIVPSFEIAKYTSEGHAEWLATPGKKGQPHVDNNMRVFSDKNGLYLERWDLLQLNIHK